jgi:hypothetical protein
MLRQQQAEDEARKREEAAQKRREAEIKDQRDYQAQLEGGIIQQPGYAGASPDGLLYGQQDAAPAPWGVAAANPWLPNPGVSGVPSGPFTPMPSALPPLDKTFNYGGVDIDYEGNIGTTRADALSRHLQANPITKPEKVQAPDYFVTQDGGAPVPFNGSPGFLDGVTRVVGQQNGVPLLSITDKPAPVRGRRADGSIEPNGGLTNAEFNGYSNSFVPKEMVGVLGGGFKGAFEVGFRDRLESGLYLRPTGEVDAVRAAQDAKDATLGSWEGSPNFGPMQRYDVNGDAQWADPSLNIFTEGKKHWYGDTKDKIETNIPTNTVPAAHAADVLKEATFFNENVRPYVQKGYVTIPLLKEWLKGKNVPWTEESINAWLQNGMVGSPAVLDAAEF